MVDNVIPFYANTPDATHCRQASYKMVVEHFYPDKRMSFDLWDIISHKVKDKWTWQMAGHTWISENGFEVVDIGEFDYRRFITEGVEYLKAEYGDEIAEAQDQNSDIEGEQEIAKSFLKKVSVEKRAPTFEDIENLLEDGYLLTADINHLALLGEEGHENHTVVIKGYDGDELILNDPGPDSCENMRVSRDAFLKAWASPNTKALNLTAIRRKGPL